MADQRRWDVGLVAAIVTVAFGLLFASPALTTAAVIGLLYALYGSVSSPPSAVSLAATREFEFEGTGPGSAVQVALELENTGSAVVPDLRVVDGVPDSLTVVSGSSSGGFPLRPDEKRTIQYTVVLQRGRFEFEEPGCQIRSFAGTGTTTIEPTVSGDSAIRCADTFTDPPVSDATLQQAGTVPTDTAGSGLEFYSTRQYHRGDPMNRINWHQVAKTGEFVTVQYRRERAARTVVVIDCRPCTRVRQAPGYPTGAAFASYAAEQLHEALREEGVVTTLTAVGLDGDVEHLLGPDGLPWVDHSAADGSATALFRGIHKSTNPTNSQSTSDSSPAGPDQLGPTQQTAGVRADGGEGESSTTVVDQNRTERLLSRLPAAAEVVICTPLLDRWPVEFADELRQNEYSVRIVSPNVTGGESAGKRLEAVDRRRRIRTLERTGAHVTDWDVADPVEFAVSTTLSNS